MTTKVSRDSQTTQHFYSIEHNQSEKCRRAQLRDRLDALADLLPAGSVPIEKPANRASATRKTTLNLLNRAASHIKVMSRSTLISTLFAFLDSTLETPAADYGE